jgi:hypothetical protein
LYSECSTLPLVLRVSNSLASTRQTLSKLLRRFGRSRAKQPRKIGGAGKTHALTDLLDRQSRIAEQSLSLENLHLN